MNRIKHRKLPQWIQALDELVPIIDSGCRQWQVSFADEGESIQSVGKFRTEIFVFRVASSLSVTIPSQSYSTLKAVESTAMGLRAAGSRCRPYLSEDRCLVAWCSPSDVRALAQLVAKIEGLSLRNTPARGAAPGVGGPPAFWVLPAV